MSFTVVQCEQRSPEWFACRAGRLTSTGAADMLAVAKKEGAGLRHNLRLRLALERITGRPIGSSYTSGAMEDGIEREPDALAAYETLTRQFVEHSGFLRHDALMAGTSLDGHVGEFTGIVEAKAPTEAVHWGYVQTGAVPTKYLRQITHHLWMTGAKWADFLSFNPHFPPSLRVKLVRVHRADVDLTAYELALTLFLSEVEREYQEIAALAKGAA